ncbi:TPA: hypothetical protein DHW51_15320 [Candidatus Poribacteria bacterium]|nr:hypothetical protein [Candidatus Poribacteria bacterium]
MLSTSHRRNDIRPNHLTCYYTIPKNNYLISVVPQDISRVFLNILNNACYAAHQRAQTADEGFAPTLWVRTKGVSDQVQIGIKDNDTGIPEEILNKIFEPFMTTKPSGSGTGLGLSSVMKSLSNRRRYAGRGIYRVYYHPS